MITGLQPQEYPLDDTYSVKVYESFESFLSLREMWDKMLDTHGFHEPFLCHDWFRIWLKHFLENAGLLITILFRDGVPVLIAPLLKKSDQYKRVSRVRKIEFIGNVNSPINNIIYGDSSQIAKKEFLSYLFTFFTNVYVDWDIIELNSIPEELSYYDMITDSVSKTKLAYRVYSCFNDWRLEDINCSGTDYLNSRSKNCKKEIRRRIRRLEEEGNVDIDITSNNYDYERYIGIYNNVRFCSWKSPENDGAFLDEYRRYAMSKSMLRFSTVSLNNKPMSCHIRIISKDTAYLMESVYDSEYKEFSPTTILRANLMKYMIDEEKVTTIDTIKGDEEYKKEWTPVRRARNGITIFNATPKGYIFSFIMLRILPLIRRCTSKF